MGRGGEGALTRRHDQPISWDEVRKHDEKSDERWLVIEDQVYNITNWALRHPGGKRVITHYAGQDASEAFRAFHNDLSHVKKYLKPIKVGQLEDDSHRQQEIVKDFNELRDTAEKMGLFKPSYFFYFTMLAHILVIDALAYLNMSYFGIGWIPYLVSLLLCTVKQTQVGWLQHDFGHLSVFKNSFLDHSVHHFCMGFIKGSTAGWWNHMHYQHHAKPNIIDKDPDIRVEKLFVLGEKMPLLMAQEGKSSMPYQHQHKYFFLIAPPLLFPVYFQTMMIRHVITRRLWVDFIWMMSYYIKLFYLYTPLLGIGGTIVFYFLIRICESHWFVWVTQSNHIPMEIDKDSDKHWVPLQIHATCDIEQSFFNDWFTGHLNFQCEHHLFPTMPRHNYYKIQPLVKSMCKKHNIPFAVKPLWQSFVDIYKSLKNSGEIWYSAYEALHH